MMTSRWTLSRIAALAVVVLVLADLVDGVLHAALAQNPFGAPKGAVPDSQLVGIV